MTDPQATCGCGCHSPGNTNDEVYEQVCCPKLSDSAAKAREQWTVPKHEHTHSVFVRCLDCLTFGTPMPGEYQCGNCNSHNTVSYNPPCCNVAALKAERQVVKAECSEHCNENWKQGYRRGSEEARNREAAFWNKKMILAIPEAWKAAFTEAALIRVPAAELREAYTLGLEEAAKIAEGTPHAYASELKMKELIAERIRRRVDKRGKEG